jgi:hypothetical protein
VIFFRISHSHSVIIRRGLYITPRAIVVSRADAATRNMSDKFSNRTRNERALSPSNIAPPPVARTAKTL